MKHLFISGAAALAVLASEPSAFSAGDLSSDSPYGLTQTEKYILENKNSIDDLQKRLVQLEGKIDDLISSLDAFRSLTAGGNEKIFNISRDIKQLGSDVALQKEYQAKIDGELKTLAEADKASQARDDKITLAVKELSGLIDNINNTYVHKSEMKEALEKLVKQLQSSGAEASAAPKAGFSGKKDADIFDQAKADFKAKKRSQAQSALEHLAQNSGYKKAEVLYLLGELYYQQGMYSQAISVFKNSVKLDDKADYLPVLLFHTGVAYDKMKKKNEAKKFYESLITMYPKSYLVESAKKRLARLQ